jgi:hypothetical protein
MRIEENNTTAGAGNNKQSAADTWKRECQIGSASADALCDQLRQTGDPNIIRSYVSQLASNKGLDSAESVGFFTRLSENLLV